jgi:hypothetical protein
MHWRPSAVAILIAATALALAACSGRSSTPQVASVGTGTSGGPGSGSGTSAGSTPATQPDDVTSLLNEWAACERGNGDPARLTRPSTPPG